MIHPLQITARLQGPIRNADRVALDGLLAYAVAMDLGLPPLPAQDAAQARASDALIRQHLPLAMEPRGRFHLASLGQYAYEPGGYD